MAGDCTAILKCTRCSVNSARALLSNHRKCLKMIQRIAYARVRLHINGLPEVQSLALRGERGATESRVIMRLVLTIAKPARDFFPKVDQILPAAECTMVSTTEAPKIGRFATSA